MFQAASTIGIALENNQEYAFLETLYMSPFHNFKRANPTDIYGKQFQTLDEGSFGYKKIALNPNLHYNLTGYFQSEKYFQGCSDLIKNIFEFKHSVNECAEAKINEIKNKYPGKKIIGVHLRLGDYLNLKEHHTCLTDTNYYFNAINIFGLEDNVFYVFHNDETKALEFFTKLKQILPSLQFEINKQDTPPIDMCTFSLTDGCIIANSSFSWWGAWLNKCDDKLKLSPQKERWFGPAYSDMEVNDIIPDRWRQIIC